MLRNDTGARGCKRGPLAECIVVERAGRVGAAIAAGLLGELGATVLRVEPARGRPPSDPADWHAHPLVLAGKSRVEAGSSAEADPLAPLDAMRAGV